MRKLTLALALATSSLPVSLSAQTLHLIPQPRFATPSTVLPLPQGIRLTCAAPCDAEDAFAVADLRQTLSDRGIPSTEAANAPHILVTRFSTPTGRQTYAESLTPAPATPPSSMPAEMAAEGYAIIPDRDGLALTAQTATGVFYALQTVKQLIAGSGNTASLQLATIRDWPAMQYRGLSDDLSRGPIDTLEFQKKLVRTLAAYKNNIYSPYFEGTQAYPSNSLAAIPGAAMTPAEAQQLVAYAAQYHITVVPEQEAFGHLHHMLLFDKYTDAAETPYGNVLAPSSPQSMQIIDGMFKDLAKMYPGPFLHVGADETFDLGMGKTRADVDARGLSPAYLDFMQKIVTDLQPLNRKILFWADIAENQPALLKAMPQSFKDRTIAISWHYTAPKQGGFTRITKIFTDSGLPFWVAPAINNYRQVWPNQQAMFDDIQQFTRDGQHAGATGQLNTLWNDDGESLANMNWYGILYGAAAAWQQGESSIDTFRSNYGPVFHGDTTGLVNQAQDELAAAMKALDDAKVVTHVEGTDGLFWVDPWSAEGQTYAAKIRPLNMEVRLHAENAIQLIQSARYANPNLREQDALDAMDFGARRIDFLCLKFELSDQIIHNFAQAQANITNGNWKEAKPGVASLLGSINGVDSFLNDLIYGYAQLRDQYEQQWLRTNRPANLRPVLLRYDNAASTWLKRSDSMRWMQTKWRASHTLDATDITNIGIPAPPSPVAPSPNEVKVPGQR